jgi:hypothetical protein
MVCASLTIRAPTCSHVTLLFGGTCRGGFPFWSRWWNDNEYENYGRGDMRLTWNPNYGGFLVYSHSHTLDFFGGEISGIMQRNQLWIWPETDILCTRCQGFIVRLPERSLIHHGLCSEAVAANMMIIMMIIILIIITTISIPQWNCSR